MSKRELIERELEQLPEQEHGSGYRIHACIEGQTEEDADVRFAAEAALAKDWLTSEEDAAWASL